MLKIVASGILMVGLGLAQVAVATSDQAVSMPGDTDNTPIGWHPVTPEKKPDNRVPKFTQHELESVAKYWQRTLLLDDWDVHVHFVDLDELPPTAAGASRILPVPRVIMIDALRPSQYAVLASRYNLPELHDKEITRDIVDTVVHELLHLRLRDLAISDDNTEKDTEEMTVVRLTQALLSLRGVHVR